MITRFADTGTSFVVVKRTKREIEKIRGQQKPLIGEFVGRWYSQLPGSYVKGRKIRETNYRVVGFDPCPHQGEGEWIVVLKGDDGSRRRVTQAALALNKKFF